MKNKLYYFFLTFSLIALTASCSKDDDSGDKSDNGKSFESHITLSVTGDETGEFSSDANTAIQGSPSNGYDFIISRGPYDALSDQSFSIFFSTGYIESLPLPIPTGSFDLIPYDDLEKGDGNYAVMFNNSSTGTGFGYEVSGTINITESNDNFVKGDFNFTTTSHTSGELEVDVVGSFLAPTSW